MQNLPPVTRVLLIANVAIFALQLLFHDAQPPYPLTVPFALWPLGSSPYSDVPGFEPWQLVTYAFLHGSLAHIAFNMLALWMFGGPVEQALGSRRFTLFYFVCVLGAAFAQLATIHFFKPGDFYPTLGASGGVFGLLLAYAMIYPQARIMMMFFPVPIRAPIAVIGYMVVELVLGVTGTQEGVAHFAHLGGAAAGFVLLRLWLAQARNSRNG